LIESLSALDLQTRMYHAVCCAVCITWLQETRLYNMFVHCPVQQCIIITVIIKWNDYWNLFIRIFISTGSAMPTICTHISHVYEYACNGMY